MKITPKENSYRLSKINKFYKEWKGVRYRYGGYSKRGVDCSGMVKILNKKEFNIILPRTTKEMVKVGKKVKNKKDWGAGDLIFFKTGWGVRHVGVYMGNNKFMHASRSKGVMISTFKGYWIGKFWQTRRVI